MKTADANDLSLSNLSIYSQDTSTGTVTFQFDITWSNAWNDSVNKDAVWLFFKYSSDSGSNWYHAMLKTAGTNPSGFSTGSAGSTPINIKVSQDKVGMFIEKAAQGTGTVTANNVRAVWDYASAGVTSGNALSTATFYKIFGVEMVYVPEGGFYMGDNTDGSAASTYAFEFGSASSQAAQVTNEEAIQFTSATAGAWYYNSTGGAGEATSGSLFTLPESFPKGFQGFYMMKYEVSQGQYRDFLNTLTRTQQIGVVATTSTSFYAMSNQAVVTSGQGLRNPSATTAGIITFGMDFDADGNFNEATDGEWKAMNWIPWYSLAAFADWAGLRPMTEFEYEKASRGPITPTANENASASSPVSIQTPASEGTEDEVVFFGNMNYNNTSGAVTPYTGVARVGFTATSSTTTRAETGGSYYGAMDLSGNVWEYVVSIGDSTGRSFSGTHGDGTLSSAGRFTNPDWPPRDGGVDPYGLGVRGGAWTTDDVGTTYELQTSNRVHSYGYPANLAQQSDIGGRFVRTENS